MIELKKERKNLSLAGEAESRFQTAGFDLGLSSEVIRTLI